MNKDPNACVIIPARFKSSRFPGKPLKKIYQKEMILWVAESCSKAVGKNNVYIATDDQKIAELVTKNFFKSIITEENASTGTDRVAEASKSLNYEIIINVQGDEPLVNPDDIKKCIQYKMTFPKKIINGFTWLNSGEDPENINIPKVLTNEKNEMIYMSRKPIPGFKDLKNKPKTFKKQVCIYGFNKLELSQFKDYGRSVIEQYEDIEILRFLELNKKILMYECDYSSIAVDVPSDIKRVEEFLKK